MKPPGGIAEGIREVKVKVRLVFARREGMHSVGCGMTLFFTFARREGMHSVGWEIALLFSFARREGMYSVECALALFLPGVAVFHPPPPK